MGPERFKAFLASSQLADRLLAEGLSPPAEVGSNSQLNMAYGVDSVSSDVTYTGERSVFVAANTLEDDHPDSGRAVVVVGPYVHNAAPIPGANTELTLPGLSKDDAEWLGATTMASFIEDWAGAAVLPAEITEVRVARYAGVVLSSEGVTGDDTVTPFEPAPDPAACSPLTKYAGAETLVTLALATDMPIVPRLRQTQR